MSDEIIEKMTELLVCVKCGYKTEPSNKRGWAEKCPKCGGTMTKVVVLR